MSYQDFTVLKNSPQARRAVTPPLSNRGCGLPQDERLKDVTKENSPALCSLWSPNPPGGFGPGYRWVGHHHSLALPPSFGNGTADAWGSLSLCSPDTPSQNPAASPREGHRDASPHAPSIRGCSWGRRNPGQRKVLWPRGGSWQLGERGGGWVRSWRGRLSCRGLRGGGRWGIC